METRGESAAVTRRGVDIDLTAVGTPAPTEVHLEIVSDLPVTTAAEDTEPRRPSSLKLLTADEPGVPWLPDSSSLLAAPAWKLAVKRIIDVILASMAILLFSPVMVAAALAVKLTSRGPVFYAQDRIGRHGETFRFVKFRTMRVGADSQKEHLDDENEADGPIFKIKRDPRITSVGRIMRKLSIDEMPQLVHVVAGHMSLVGFRPPLTSEFEQYGDWERQRVRAKPGLTCIWQISGRSDLDFKTWVKMDLEYIENWSLWLDLKILALTVPAVLTGRGAY